MVLGRILNYHFSIKNILSRIYFYSLERPPRTKKLLPACFVIIYVYELLIFYHLHEYHFPDIFQTFKRKFTCIMDFISSTDCLKGFY